MQRKCFVHRTLLNIRFILILVWFLLKFSRLSSINRPTSLPFFFSGPSITVPFRRLQLLLGGLVRIGHFLARYGPPKSDGMDHDDGVLGFILDGIFVQNALGLFFKFKGFLLQWFFAPTINYLTSRAFNVHIMCLSTGNADGLGDIRKEELYLALNVLFHTRT